VIVWLARGDRGNDRNRMSEKRQDTAAAPHAAAGETGNAHGTLGRRLALAREVLEFAVHKAHQVRLAQVAGSLTFSSVLALVPLLAVVLAILTAFPVFTEFRESLERELPKGLMPVPYAQTILRYLTDFAAKATGVGAAGLAFLALSALSMILTVDHILNDIWQVHRRRPLVQRLLVYWAVLSVGPLLLGVSLSLTSYVIAVSDTRLDRFDTGLRQLFGLVPPLIATAAYTVVYALVPNRRVAWRHAATGAVVTAVTGELMSRAFAAYVLRGSVLSIYGAFAAVPIFLMWIYLSWMTFLFGAAIAATLPQLRTTRFADERRAGNRAVTALALVKLLYDARADGALRAVPLVQMVRTLRTDEEVLAELLAQLESLGYVRSLARNDAGADEWLLSCDPRVQGLGPAVHSFALDPRNSLLQRPDLGLGTWLAPVIRGEWLQRPLARIEAERETPAPVRG
jgi:membrane protein